MKKNKQHLCPTCTIYKTCYHVKEIPLIWECSWYEWNFISCMEVAINDKTSIQSTEQQRGK